MTIPIFATSKSFEENFLDVWISLSPRQRRYVLTRLRGRDLRFIESLWGLFGASHQKPPLLAQGGAPWTTWLMIGGRGAGKTRAGAEWVRAVVLGRAPFAAAPTGPIALIGETEHDVREVMIEGVSGLLSRGLRGERPTWTPSRRRLQWENGVVGYAFSAEDPESLRGPQFAAAWCDELAKWRHAEATFDMLQFGLRLGERPRQVITTTPRPIPLLKRLLKDPTAAVTRAGTRANALNLSASFLKN